jgi:uncharacterized protein (DUF1330 family)
MAAYLVAHLRMIDPSWTESEYTALLPALVEKHGGVYIAGGAHQQVEGEPLGEWTSLVRFPSLEAAQAFWNDPEYQRVAPLRRSGSESQVVLIDGVPDE